MSSEQILCAGFGGQGIMSLGQLLATAGMFENKHVSWLPSYGPEMRGGTAYCSVVISTNPVGSPVVIGSATCAIIMNLPSLIKFENAVKPGGILLVNSSLVDKKVSRKDIQVHYIRAVELAGECGSVKVANMVMLGGYLALAGSLKLTSVIKALRDVFSDKNHKLTKLNLAAIYKGAAVVTDDNLVQKAA